HGLKVDETGRGQALTDERVQGRGEPPEPVEGRAVLHEYRGQLGVLMARWRVGVDAAQLAERLTLQALTSQNSERVGLTGHCYLVRPVFRSGEYADLPVPDAGVAVRVVGVKLQVSFAVAPYVLEIGVFRQLEPHAGFVPGT